MYQHVDKSARCKEQVTLAEAIAIASGKVQQAQVGLDEAKEAKRDTRTASAMLQNVRREGRQALLALDEHKQVHQCEGPPDSSKTKWSRMGVRASDSNETFEHRTRQTLIR